VINGTDALNIIIAAIFTIEVALGLTIIFGVMKVINMAHGEFFMLGAYTMVVVTGAGLDPWIGILLAPIVLGLFGMLTERAMIRPLYGRADLSSLLATFGLSIVLQQSARLIWGPQSRTVPSPIDGSMNVFGTMYPTYRIVAAAIAVAVLVAIGFLLFRSTFGVRMRATSEDSEVASALGTNTGKISNWSFGLGTGLAGFAGALMAPFIGVVSTMGLEQTVRSFLVVITGGLGSIGGTVGGGVVIGGGQSALNIPFSGTVAQIVVLLIAILVILIRPQGLFSRGSVRAS
jgi:branched-chain amino acid transport system permease protein/urea transport system permease protein